MCSRRTGGELIRSARLSAGLTQWELARAMGTGQSVIVRWERGHRSPTMDTIRRALDICGFELETSLVRKTSGIDTTAIARLRSLSPTERLRVAALEARNLAAFDAAVRR